MPVPNSFANVTTSIPLSQLDANFNTPITLGNTAIQLGNTVTTLNNMTLANVTVTSGNVTITNVTVTTANVTTANIATAQIANVTVSGTGTFAAGSNTAPSITTSGDTNTGIFFPAADTVAIATGGSKRFEVDANGNAGLNITPSAWRSVDDALQVGQGIFGGLATSSSTRRAFMGSNIFTNSSDQDTYIANGEASLYQQNNGSHVLYSATSGTAGNACTLTSVLEARLGQPLVLQGGITSTGTGIAFPATQNASSNANTLDDYEEGSWTPVATGGTITGTGTYTLQAGRYTKIGRVCLFQMTLGWSAHTGTGTLGFSGLPFTALGGGLPGQSVAIIGYNNGLSYTNHPVIYIGNNTTEAYFTQTTTGGVLSGVPMDTVVGELIINGHYIVA